MKKINLKLLKKIKLKVKKTRNSINEKKKKKKKKKTRGKPKLVRRFAADTSNYFCEMLTR